LNEKIIEELRNPDKEKKVMKINAPGTGYKMP